MWCTGEVSPSGRCCSREILIISRFIAGIPENKGGRYAPAGDTSPPADDDDLNLQVPQQTEETAVGAGSSFLRGL